MSGSLLVWSDRAHWGGGDKPCRYCGSPTPLRDEQRKPSHKVCAELALATESSRKDAA